MKKTFLILLTTGLFAITASAQDAPPPSAPGKPHPPMISKEEREKKKAEREAQLTKSLKDLGATDEQVQKVKDALEDAHKKHEDLKKDATLSEEDKKAKGKEIMDAQKAKLKEILGEQKAKQFGESQKALMKKNMPPPPPAPAP